jgi:hypothetical protein
MGRDGVENSQHSRGVGASATESAADRNSLLDHYLEATRPSGFVGIERRRAVGEIVLLGLVPHDAAAECPRFSSDVQTHIVAQVEPQKNRLDRMVPVRLFVENSQGQIDLCLGESPSAAPYHAAASGAG